MPQVLESNVTGLQQAADADKIACLSALERKVLWLSTWMIHNANHLRPNRDGLKVGGHQASSASVATLMTALYFDVLRPQDRVAVKPHASPVFHAIQFLLGHQTRDKLERFRGLWRGSVISLADKRRRHRRFLDWIGRARGRHDFVQLDRAGLCPAETADADRRARRPHDRARRRCRTRRGQYLRSIARRLETRRPQSVVGHRLQSPEPRCGGFRSSLSAASTRCSR